MQRQEQLSQFENYTTLKVVGKGTFGMVYLVKDPSNRTLAIKHVLQDKRYKNRELEITMKLNHPNIVKLQSHFYSATGNKEYLNLVLEYLPQNLSQKIRLFKQEGKFIPNETIKCFSQQLFEALVYLKKANVCHRDIKPSNILIGTHDELKLCDFGSAKCLVKGQKNISYICSRYYRAPQLIFGAVQYTNQVDVWSAACVIAEMAINRPIFDGQSSTDQLAKIMRLLGTVTLNDIKDMKAKQLSIELPTIQPISLKRYLKKMNPGVDESLVEFLTKVLVYNPNRRLSPEEALQDPYFSPQSQA